MGNVIMGPKCHYVSEVPLRNSLIFVTCLFAWLVTPAAAQSNDGDQLLNAAQAYMRQASGYHVELEITFPHDKASVKADIAGDDYDISIIGTKIVKSRGVRQKYWASDDGGKTWQETDYTDGKATFDLLIAPIYGGHVGAISDGRVVSDAGQKLVGEPHYVVTERHSEAGKTVTLLELRSPDDSSPENERIRYWVAQSDGKTWIERSAAPTRFLGSDVFVDARYSKVGEISKIDPPPKN